MGTYFLSNSWTIFQVSRQKIIALLIPACTNDAKFVTFFPDWRRWLIDQMLYFFHDMSLMFWLFPRKSSTKSCMCFPQDDWRVPSKWHISFCHTLRFKCREYRCLLPPPSISPTASGGILPYPTYLLLYDTRDLKQSGRQRQGRPRLKNKFLPLIRISKLVAYVYRLMRRHTSTSG